MKNRSENIRLGIAILGYLLLWSLLNAFVLKTFPFVHSDEIWLAGITQTMIEERSFMITEPFFTLLPRTVHALRLMFHILQGFFIILFDYSLIGIRSLSLVSGAVALLFFFILLKKLTFSNVLSYMGMVLLSLDIQFLYASHFGRQEIVLIVFMMVGLVLFFSHRVSMYSGICCGLAAGVHPNGFIIALPVSFLMLLFYRWGRRQLKDMLLFFLTAGVSAGLFILFSLLMNGEFIREYLEFGASVGVRTGFAERLTDFLPFFYKLFFQLSGTYYTPNIRVQLVLLPLLCCWGIIRFLWTKEAREAVGTIGLIGVSVGLIIIGKYSQPSIIFYFPFFYILLLSVISGVHNKKPVLFFPVCRKSLQHALISVIVIVSLSFTIYTVYQEVKKEGSSFSDFTNRIQAGISPGSKVLVNINGGLACAPADYIDWRNLQYLRTTGQDLREYILSEDIDYIVYPEELDYIYHMRPVWNLLYGNVYPWYKELQDFLHSSCRLVDSFESPGYAMRIASLRFRRDWKVCIYNVIPEATSADERACFFH